MKEQKVMCELEDDLNEFAAEIAKNYDLPVPKVLLTSKFKRVWGKCNANDLVIRMNRFFCENNEFEVVYDLLKHEMAHLRASGHGDAFKGVCADMGILHRTYLQHPDCVTEKGTYTYMCPECGRFYRPFRAYKHSKSCGDCSNGVYNPKFKLIDVTA